MAVNVHFRNKCQDIVSDLSSSELLDEMSPEFSRLYVEKLLKTYKLEAVLRLVLDASGEDLTVARSAYHLLNIPDTADSLTGLAVALGKPWGLHNSLVAGADSIKSSGLNIKDYGYESIFMAVIRLWKAGKSRPYLFDAPHYQFLGDVVLEASQEAGVPLDVVLGNRSVIEIHASAQALKKYGVELFSKERDEHRKTLGEYPYYYLQHCDRDELLPTFELVSHLHGRYVAQTMMTAGASPQAVFLRADELASHFGENSSEMALKRFLASGDAIYKRPLQLMVSALKQEGMWQSLDRATAREAKQLFKQGLIVPSELPNLPRMTAIFSEERLRVDLGL